MVRLHAGDERHVPINPKASKRLVIVVPNDLAEQVEALAKKDRRPVSAYVRCLLEDHVRAAELRAAADRMGGSVGIFPPPEL